MGPQAVPYPRRGATPARTNFREIASRTAVAHSVMAKNLLVINVDIRETRVALIEDGIIAELHIERETSKGTLGNIYLGRVSRVLPGMQAAFIDVGLERAAFLHVEDLIRPDDFEAYLAGHRRTQDEDRASGPTPEQALADEDGAARPRPRTTRRASRPRAASRSRSSPRSRTISRRRPRRSSPTEDRTNGSRPAQPADERAPTEHDATGGRCVRAADAHEAAEAAPDEGDDLDAADDEIPAEGEPVVELAADEDAGAPRRRTSCRPTSAERARDEEPQAAGADEPQAQAAGAETEDVTMPRARRAIARRSGATLGPDDGSPSARREARDDRGGVARGPRGRAPGHGRTGRAGSRQQAAPRDARRTRGARRPRRPEARRTGRPEPARAQRPRPRRAHARRARRRRRRRTIRCASPSRRRSARSCAKARRSSSRSRRSRSAPRARASRATSRCPAATSSTCRRSITSASRSASAPTKSARACARRSRR